MHVVGIQVASVGASGKTTSAVARVQRAANCGRNRARLATDVQWLALRILHNAYYAGVAREPPGGLYRQRGTLLELAPSGDALLQRLGIYLHYNLVALTGIERL